MNAACYNVVPIAARYMSPCSSGLCLANKKLDFNFLYLFNDEVLKTLFPAAVRGFKLCWDGLGPEGPPRSLLYKYRCEVLFERKLK